MPIEDPKEARGEPAPALPARSANRKARAFPWKITVALLVVAAIALVAAKRRSQAAPETRSTLGAKGALPPVSVVIGTVAQKDVPIYLDGLGTVQAFNTVTVRSRVDGQLQKLSFTEGQEVHAGDLLAQIDPAPFKTQVAQAEAKQAQDEAQLAFARIELKRDADLLAIKIVSPEAYDTQKAQVNQFEAAVRADQAAVDSAKVQLNYSSIIAPIDGRTGIRLVDQGNIVHAAESNGIVVLAQLRPISVVFTLPEQSLKEIQKHQAAFSSDPLPAGQPADSASPQQMTVLAVDRDNRTVLDEGRLAVIDNQIDTSTGTIRLKATFPNPNLSLWPGQFVNARLLLEVRQGAVVVPAPVVQRGPEGAYAFVVQDDMTVKMRSVKVTPLDQERALIDQGLAPGERAVVDGQYRLQLGSKTKPAEPGKNEIDGKNTNLATLKEGPTPPKDRTG